MRRLLPCALFAFLLLGAAESARANNNLHRLNQILYGRVVDYSHNHGQDNRIISPMLGQKRDMYVYLPPDYQAATPCNLVLWFHGAFGDEQIMFALARLEVLDRLIASGVCPPTIVAIPDVSVAGGSSFLSQHSFVVNGKAGRFEDHIMQEVVPFLERTYSIRAGREARAITGVSAGGFGAMSIGMKHREKFAVIAALAPPANLRCGNVQGKYHQDFDPAKYRWRETYNPREVVGTFLNGVVRLREGSFVGPIFGPQKNVLENVKRNNPADLLFTEDVQPGQLNIFIHYPKNDNFNFDAQVESFQWLAQTRGIPITLVRDDQGQHTIPYFQNAMPALWVWLSQAMPRLEAHIAVSRVAAKLR